MERIIFSRYAIIHLPLWFSALPILHYLDPYDGGGGGGGIVLTKFGNNDHACVIGVIHSFLS